MANLNVLTINEYLEMIKATELKSEKLAKNETVYLVEKCNITSFTVYGLFIVDYEECAVLIGKESARFIHMPLSSLGKDLFESIEKARDEVAKRLPLYDCILQCEMNVTEYKGYQTAKKGVILTAFYAVLDNGYVYYKDYFSCGHLMNITKKEADKLLEESINQYDMIPKRNKTMPELKNMYKVIYDAGNGWIYAESSYPLTSAS